MIRQPLPGIDGVLDNLLTPGRAHAVPNANAESAPMNHARVSAASDSSSSHATGARRGRPLGTNCREGVGKEKVTFRVSCDLAAAYRGWSWEVRSEFWASCGMDGSKRGHRMTVCAFVTIVQVGGWMILKVKSNVGVLPLWPVERFDTFAALVD